MSCPRRPTSVQVQIPAAVGLTTTSGMVGAGMTSYLLAGQATYESIDLVADVVVAEDQEARG